MGQLIVLGIDPGITNLGYGILAFDEGADRLLDTGVLSTKPANKRRRLHAADDFFGRIIDQGQHLLPLVEKYKPRLIAVEAFSAPRNASSAAKLAGSGCMALGLSVGLRIPQVCVHRDDVFQVVGIPNATKEEVIEWAKQRWTQVQWPVASKCEHAADAAAIALTAVRSPANAALTAILQTS